MNVGDIWDVVEVALGGKAITTTVEDRQRFPVRVRYARSFRQDEEDVKNLLINAGSAMASGTAGGGWARRKRREANPLRELFGRSRFPWSPTCGSWRGPP